MYQSVITCKDGDIFIIVFEEEGVVPQQETIDQLEMLTGDEFRALLNENDVTPEFVSFVPDADTKETIH